MMRSPGGSVVACLLAVAAAACSQAPKAAIPSPTPALTPAEGPAGTIAFASDRGGSLDIYAINVDGSGLTQLTTDRAEDIEPAWSPDGTRIAYSSGPQIYVRGVSNRSIWVMNADGSGQTRLTRGADDRWPAWSPDGSRIVFSRQVLVESPHLYTMNADGSDVRQLTDGRDVDIEPTWTGDKILFKRALADERIDYGDVFAVNPDGSGIVRLTTGQDVGNFAVSPEGTRLVIQDASLDSIVVLSAYESAIPVVIVDEDFGVEFVRLAWSADGRSLVLAGSSALARSAGADYGNLWVVAVDGSGLARVPNGHSALDPAWKPT